MLGAIGILDVVADVCRRLESAGIDYMISGSFAANMYAEPRFTNDADIVLQAQAHQAKTLLSLFTNDYYISEQAIEDAFSGIGLFNIIHNKLLFKCDLILLKQDEFSRSAFQRRVRRTLSGNNLFFLSLEDLILQKALWRKESGSETQLRDIERLISQNTDILDRQYCSTWMGILGIEESLGKLL